MLMIELEILIHLMVDLRHLLLGDIFFGAHYTIIHLFQGVELGLTLTAALVFGGKTKVPPARIGLRQA